MNSRPVAQEALVDHLQDNRSHKDQTGLTSAMSVDRELVTVAAFGRIPVRITLFPTGYRMSIYSRGHCLVAVIDE